MAPHKWRFNLLASIFLFLHFSQLPHQPSGGIFLVTSANTKPFNTGRPVNEFAKQPRPSPESFALYLVFGSNQVPHPGRFDRFPITGQALDSFNTGKRCPQPYIGAELGFYNLPVAPPVGPVNPPLAFCYMLPSTASVERVVQKVRQLPV